MKESAAGNNAPQQSAGRAARGASSADMLAQMMPMLNNMTQILQNPGDMSGITDMVQGMMGGGMMPDMGAMFSGGMPDVSAILGNMQGGGMPNIDAFMPQASPNPNAANNQNPVDITKRTRNIDTE